MRRLLLAGLLAASDLSAAKLLSHSRQGNRVQLRLSEGSGEIEFLSGSSFRVTRSASRAWPSREPIVSGEVPFRLLHRETSLRLETDILGVDVDKATGAVSVRNAAGIPVAAEAGEARFDAAGAALAFTVSPTERFFGLGPRTGAVDARGSQLTLIRPFVMSGRGYGLYFPPPALLRVDVGAARPDTLAFAAVDAARIEYFFYFGPSIKEILEEHVKVPSTYETPPVEQLGWVASLPRLATALPPVPICELPPLLVNASLSAIFLPAFDLAQYRADEVAYRRALQLAAVSPVMFQSGDSPRNPAAETARRRWSHYLLTYFDEVRTRGFPILHPLVMQFPKDYEAAKQNDAYMFGDEMLAAPVCGAAKRAVYLPQGIWTEWRTNRVHNGRQTVEVEHPLDDPLPPLFARNGTIIPLAPSEDGGPTELHYFPKLGGEFFFFEPEAMDYSQVHASPAADVMRLEIESKVPRVYEWVVHHQDAPKRVVSVEPAGDLKPAGARKMLRPGAWWYDAKARNVHVQVEGPAGADVIVNIVPR